MKRSGLLSLVGVTVLLASFASACGQAKVPPGSEASPGSETSSANSTTVIIDNFNYYPPVLTVARGTTVTWTNRYPLAHRVNSDGASPNFSSPNLNTGLSFTWTFTESGNYTYHCEIHPTMKGTIVVE